MKTRYTAIAVAALAVPLLTACPPPSPPTFVPRTEYWQGLYPVSTDPTVQFRIEPGLYMSEVDSFPDDVNREDASGNIFAPPVTDRVLIEVESTDISVEVVQGHLVRWAARVPALFPGRYVEGMYLSWTELGPGHLSRARRWNRRCQGVGQAEGHQR